MPNSDSVLCPPPSVLLQESEPWLPNWKVNLKN